LEKKKIPVSPTIVFMSGGNISREFLFKLLPAGS
jgi:hypothetical protein